MLNLNSILLFSENPAPLAEFYGKIFDTKPVMAQDNYTTYIVGSSALTIGPHDQVHGPSSNPERIIINFETGNVQADFERIKNMGTKVIQEPYNPSEQESMQLATFADPDGNYFQLASPYPR